MPYCTRHEVLLRESVLVGATPHKMSLLASFDGAMGVLLDGNEKEVVVSCLGILDKIVLNVIRNPLEAKYRKVKASNKSFAAKVGAVAGSDAVMTALGFMLVDGEWVLDPSEEKWNVLVAAQQKLQRFQYKLNTPPLDPSSMNQEQMIAVFQAALAQSSAPASAAATPAAATPAAAAAAAKPSVSTTTGTDGVESVSEPTEATEEQA